MWDDLAAHFEALFAPLFPIESEFGRRPADNGLRFSICWKLNNDPARPNKRSRRIILVLPDEVLEDYRDDDDHGRGVKDTRFADSITQRLAHFNPDHQTPYGQADPEEPWVLT